MVLAPQWWDAQYENLTGSIAPKIKPGKHGFSAQSPPDNDLTRRARLRETHPTPRIGSFRLRAPHSFGAQSMQTFKSGWPLGPQWPLLPVWVPLHKRRR